jgi:hypothetical protein
VRLLYYCHAPVLFRSLCTCRGVLRTASCNLESLKTLVGRPSPVTRSNQPNGIIIVQLSCAYIIFFYTAGMTLGNNETREIVIYRQFIRTFYAGWLQITGRKSTT